MSVVLAQPEIRTEGDVLYADILRNPSDDTLRLIYADWCEDTGNHARAAFIRAQIRVHRAGGVDCKHKTVVQGSWNDRKERCGTCEFCKGMAEATKLLSSACAAGARWPYTQTAEHWSVPPSWGPYAQPATTATFGLSYQRGFVEAVRCRTSAWLRWGPELVRQYPLSRVVPSDRAPRSIGREFFWYLSDRAPREDGDTFGSTSGHLPPELHGVRDDNMGESVFRQDKYKFYVNQMRAYDAYSDECLRWAVAAGVAGPQAEATGGR